MSEHGLVEPAEHTRAPLSGLAVTGFVLGIISLVLCWIFLVQLSSLLLFGPAALVFSVIGLVSTRKGRRRGRGLAISGAVLGVVTIAISIVTSQMWSRAWVAAEDLPLHDGAATGTRTDALPFDQPVTFTDGLRLTVSKPELYSPTETPDTKMRGDSSYQVSFTVTNVGSDEALVESNITGYTANGSNCPKLYDPAQASGVIDGPLQPGQTVAADIAFTCYDPSQMAIQINLTSVMWAHQVWFDAP